MKNRLLSISLTLCMIVANISALGVFALAEEATDYSAAPEVAEEQTQTEELVEEVAEEDNSAVLSSEEDESTLSYDADVPYLSPVYKNGDYKSGLQKMETKLCYYYVLLTSDSFPEKETSRTLGSSSYVVRGNIECDYPIVVNGNAKLIIEDGASLSVRGIFVNEGNSIEIYGQSGNTGRIVTERNDGCGIGGDGSSNGWITINGGIIEAKGGEMYAGIGGAKYHSGGNIIINGGNVTAKTAGSGAGIGGGLEGDGSNIYINGGVVNATGYESAGIGGGSRASGYQIYINGGDVTATGRGSGPDKSPAGIGGGCGGDGYEIFVSNAKLTAKSEQAGAGIGGGYYRKPWTSSTMNGSGRNIHITNSDVTAIGGKDAAGIGGAEDGNGEYIYITDSTVLAKIYEDDECSAAAIGGGENGSGNHIYITRSTVEAYAGSNGAGIGGGDGSNDKGDGGDADDIIIKDSDVTAHGDDGGAGIGGGKCGNGTNITIDNSIIHAIGRNGGAGIGSGYKAKSNDKDRKYGYGDTIKIINGSDVDAKSDDSYYGGAGIGGGYKSSGENITIEDSTVVATGGCDSAGIGGGEGSGDGVDGKKITIKNSYVTATGEDCGAGIGGGEGGSGMQITIDNSVATATSLGQGAGIGGGYKGNGIDINILNGSDVTAYGGKDSNGGAGIGGGYNHLGDKITIKDSKVRAYGGDDAAGIGGGSGSGDGNNGTSILLVDSDVYAEGDEGGAGIGGGTGGAAHTITIQETKEGATKVVAKGGYDGAGIGGGKGNCKNNGLAWWIRLEGGTVEATGGAGGGAGIGGGNGAISEFVYVSNTKLTAEGGNGNADAIGSGQGVGESKDVHLTYEDGGDYQITFDGKSASFNDGIRGVRKIQISRIAQRSGKHVHKWTYTADGSSLRATCSAGGHEGSKQYVIQMSEPDDCAYDGSAKAVKLNGTIAGVKTPAVKYYKGSKALKKAPSAVGTYTAKLTLGKATASVTYTIAKAEDIEKYNANLETIEDIQLTQNAAVATKNGKITVSWAAPEGYEMTSYQIYRASSENGKYTKIGTVKAGTLKYVNAKNLKKGKTYYYKVRGTAKFGALTAYTRLSEAQSAKCRKTVK